MSDSSGSNGHGGPTAGAPNVTLRPEGQGFMEWLDYFASAGDADFPHPVPLVAAFAASRIRELEAQQIEGVHLDTIKRAYQFAVTVDGQLWGLVAGDMGYEDTGIRVDMTGWWLEPDLKWTQEAGDAQALSLPPISKVADRQRAPASVAPNPGGTVPAQARSTKEEA
jgi:hypothetical protein